jgi:hypothetical protein
MPPEGTPHGQRQFYQALARIVRRLDREGRTAAALAAARAAGRSPDPPPEDDKKGAGPATSRVRPHTNIAQPDDPPTAKCMEAQRVPPPL